MTDFVQNCKRTQPFTSDDVVWFLTKLSRRYRKRDLLVIWDGAAIHRSQVVKAFLGRKAGRVYLERLLAYSPELNPVELLWSALKRSLKNQVFTILDQLQKVVLEHLNQWHADPGRVSAFFSKKEIAFFTD